jgi:hypothetical protein
MKKFLISAAVLVMSLSMAFTVSAYHFEMPEDADQVLNEYFATAEVFPVATCINKEMVTDYPLEFVPEIAQLALYAYDPAVSDVYYTVDWKTYDSIVEQQVVTMPEIPETSVDPTKTETIPLVINALGDFYIDGSAGLNDVILFGKYLGGKVDFTDEQKISADVYADGVLNANDLFALIKYSFGEIDSLPVIPSV